MKSTKVLLPLFLLGTATYAGWNGRADNTPVAEIMREKLRHAQKVLEALAIEDFDRLADEARALRALSQSADFQVLPTLEYRRHSTEFQRLTAEIEAKAKEKSLDGAALVYVQMTMNCVNCHKHVRSVRTASLSLPRTFEHYSRAD